MYKVFVNEKVICFTNNEENCNQFEQKLVLHFFSIEYIHFLFLLLNGEDKKNIVIVVTDYEVAFKKFQKYPYYILKYLNISNYYLFWISIGS